MDSAEDFHRLLSEQRRELAAAEAMDSDFDFAFRLQLQEALAASLASSPSPSFSTLPNEQPLPDDAVFNATALQLEELARIEQEIKDREMIEFETRKTREDLCRRIHDQRLAAEITTIPEDDWDEWGDEFEKPFGEGGSGSKGPVRFDEGAVFRVYFKGLVSEERVRGETVVLAGIGVAICDPSDNLIFEVTKPLIGNGRNKVAAEAKALIEALDAAIALDLTRFIYFCDSYPLFQFVTGK